MMKTICKPCIDQSKVIAPFWFIFPHKQARCGQCGNDAECVEIPVGSLMQRKSQAGTISEQVDRLLYVAAALGLLLSMHSSLDQHTRDIITGCCDEIIIIVDELRKQ
jgi:hypothetical protein